MNKLGKPVTLDDILVSKGCIVKRLQLKKTQKIRFAEMGVYPGAIVTVKRRAPLGCPIQIEAKSCNLCIRSEDATRVIVTPQYRQV